MYEKYGDDILWFVELLYDDLWDWQNWFWNRRRCPPYDLICLGSDPNPPSLSGDGSNTKQDAQYESGLDNSPMWDNVKLPPLFLCAVVRW